MKPPAIDLIGDPDSDDNGAPPRKGKKASRIKAIGDYLRQRAADVSTGTASGSRPLRVAQLAAADEAAPLVLCTGGTQLFNTTLVDRGWACGYRNCQMLVSSLLASATTSQAVAGRIAAGRAPSIGELQQMLELAWRDGYDPDGAAQLGHRVLGTHKWIGATEIYCILAHLGVQARIVDFHCPTAPDGTHPALFAWIVDYFTAGSGGESDAPDGGGLVRFSGKHPLYLQHQGHSRTIVGVEMADAATCLLVFDPDRSHRPHVDPPVRLSEFRLLLGDTRRAQQYQVVYVDDLAPSPAAKHITSVRVP
ncbi:hypothetical protein H4R19_003336 [Coemansia spiralis]|nr:hypothetical protein H4R19_003336 [Coemansia spiralis]